MIAVPFVSVFLLSQFFKMQPVCAAFSPPRYIYGVVWAYLTIALGITTQRALDDAPKYSSWIMTLFVLLLGSLLAWIPMYSMNRYYAFWTLVLAHALAVMYALLLTHLGVDRLHVLAIAPLCMWLNIATALNGVSLGC